jgi:hypothetical protein
MRKMLFLLAAAGQLFAGGFWLETGNPEASAEARALEAAVVVRAIGCHKPADALVSGVAIGFVNGERKTIPLKVVALREPAMFAVTRQWPSEGKWAIQLVGKYNGAVTSAVMIAGPDGVDRKNAKFFRGLPEEAEVNAMLRTELAQR